jgi:hypothetical protein
MSTDKDLNPMNVLKPLNIKPKILDETQPFTTFKIGKIWVNYMRNSMSIQILSYFLQHCQDEDIRDVRNEDKVIRKLTGCKCKKRYRYVVYKTSYKHWLIC